LCPNTWIFELCENAHFWPVFDENRLFLSQKSPFLMKNGHFRDSRKSAYWGVKRPASLTGIFPGRGLRGVSGR
jgi:hypothetical protein